MDMRELRYFAAVFELRNLTAAARRCFVSQPSVSAAIASLEADVDTTLFVRHKRGMLPTAAAEQLYPIARRMIDELEAVPKLLRARRTQRTLTLGLMRSLDVRRTLELLAPIAALPDLQLRLVEATARCDARIVSRVMLARRESFVPLWTERYVVALPPSHELVLRDRLRAADLDGVRWIDRCHCENHARFGRGRVRVETAAIAQSEEWALALVAAGVGVAVLPEGVARQSSHIVVRELVDVDVRRDVGIAYGRGRKPSPELARAIALLRSSGGLERATSSGTRRR
jgi:DNA-binding transcriptional LysR family regulator